MKKIWIGVAVAALLVIFALVALRIFKGASSGRVYSENSGSDTTATMNFDASLKQAQELETQGELLAAQEIYKDTIRAYASRPDIEKVQEKLEDLNMRILLSALNVEGKTTVRVVKPRDTLSMIADEYHTTAAFIARQNGLKSDVIKIGQPLRVWTSRFSVLVDKSLNILWLKADGEVVKTFRVSTGRGNITPVGTFKIVNKLTNPSWTHDGQLIPYGDPRNILGTRWMGFDIPSYGIHGTSEPESIGSQATAGCVRMLNEEVELLYDLLPVGTEVTIID